MALLAEASLNACVEREISPGVDPANALLTLHYLQSAIPVETHHWMISVQGVDFFTRLEGARMLVSAATPGEFLFKLRVTKHVRACASVTTNDTGAHHGIAEAHTPEIATDSAVALDGA